MIDKNSVGQLHLQTTVGMHPSSSSVSAPALGSPRATGALVTVMRVRVVPHCLTNLLAVWHGLYVCAVINDGHLVTLCYTIVLTSSDLVTYAD